MKAKRLSGVLPFSRVLFTLAVTLAINAEGHAKEKVLYRFTGGADGIAPGSALVVDASGNLFGTTDSGGGKGNCFESCGTVFELTPGGDSKWTEKVLYTFTGGADGGVPLGNKLVLDAAGNLYGTTQVGGTHNFGVAFELSPNLDGTWQETVLYSFAGNPDGSRPIGIVADNVGNLYGATVAGGANNSGTIFELSPSSGGGWTETVLYSFHGGRDGALPGGALIFDPAGHLYGTAYAGGNSPNCGMTGCGTVFTLKHGKTGWQETVLYSFQGGGNGFGPGPGVVRDKNGVLYGTTGSGGNRAGIIFRLEHVRGHWKESMIYNFCSRDFCTDGTYPSGLVLNQAGNLFGTTQYDGNGLSCGAVFELAHSKSGWNEAIIHRFHGADGCSPASGVIFDDKGSLYGATVLGGIPTRNYGTIFQIVR